ncbi:YciI family protein [Pseudidiomarina sp. GXY010]|uniref:YciI family protein n=1 Tax=Pseudidiomarina fusca TaxID=2965078 RepID=A0ABU3KVK5_9GAMM|nr:YciI family protein [Pseudidiomarina sp. GXY010]MDT7525506.1 YciI family protein [Pseudidiomarina sp. GXY010]
MWFVIWAEDKPNSLAARKATRPAHIERLHQLQQEGRLLVAGPCPAIASADPGDAGFTGSMVVAEFDDLAAAEAWAQADPYLAAGVYQQVTVKPYLKVLP